MMLLEKINHFAEHTPNRPALIGSDVNLDYHQLRIEIAHLMVELRGRRVNTLAIDMDNSPAWAVLDLAAVSAGIQTIPIPPFFSPQQIRHCLEQGDVQAVISDNPAHFLDRTALKPTTRVWHLNICGRPLTWLEMTGSGNKIPVGVNKVTFTSGTTGEPKGVMLAWSQIEAVAGTLAEAVEVTPADRHLVLSPLSILLENICGLYTPLWCGASVILPSLVETGLLGASGVDASRMAATLAKCRATTAIFSPQTLQGLVEHLENGNERPESLRFCAVGGAPASSALLQRAEELNLPVYEGYGLSECASVITLNSIKDLRPGSVGRVLPHMQLRLADDGEVLVKGNLFRGYLGQKLVGLQNGWWHTGDIGHLDAAGFLYLKGRKRNIFITAYGRNVSPEWVEKELVLDPAIAQAAIFGEARPFNVAVIVPSPGCRPSQVADAIAHANASLPDYARIGTWLPAEGAFTPQNGLLSGTGRVIRHSIFSLYKDRISALYKEELAS